jgi:type I restriction enzyme M protein
VDRGWTCDLIPKSLIIARYFASEQSAHDALQAESDTADAAITELEEENGGDEAAFGDLDKINKMEVAAKLRDATDDEEIDILQKWIELSEQKASLTKRIKAADAALDQSAHNHYPKLSTADVKVLAVDDKWLSFVSESLTGEVEQVAGALSRRVHNLADRYATSLPSLLEAATELELRVNEHLKAMGLEW